MNVAEKILAKAAGRKEVSPGEIVEAKIHMAMVNDVTGPLTVKAFGEIGEARVWDKDRVVIVIDHQVPASSADAAGLHAILREFALKQELKAFYDVGESGICHQVMVEKGHVRPGELVVGADSHTCTYGAVGAFGTAIGSTEMAAVFATGELWFKVPETIRVDIQGDLQKLVTPKDVILNVIGRIGANGATYKAVEFAGPTIENMDISGRMTVCNMAVEMGAKTGFIEPDDKAVAYVKARTKERLDILKNDGDGDYERTLDIDVKGLEPQLSAPFSVDNVKGVGEVAGTEIDQAFLGSCTNGRLEDLRLAGRIMRGKKVKKGVRMIVIPASVDIYHDAAKEGLIDIFLKSGAIVCNPTCGPCFGGHMGILAEGEVCVSSSNRNFVGRMGSPKARIYLASPATVAASALTGKITDPREMA